MRFENINHTLKPYPKHQLIKKPFEKEQNISQIAHCAMYVTKQ